MKWNSAYVVIMFMKTYGMHQLEKIFYVSFNHEDRYTVVIPKDDTIVGHVPRKVS